MDRGSAVRGSKGDEVDSLIVKASRHATELLFEVWWFDHNDSFRNDVVYFAIHRNDDDEQNARLYTPRFVDQIRYLRKRFAILQDLLQDHQVWERLSLANPYPAIVAGDSYSTFASGVLAAVRLRFASVLQVTGFERWADDWSHSNAAHWDATDESDIKPWELFDEIPDFEKWDLSLISLALAKEAQRAVGKVPNQIGSLGAERNFGGRPRNPDVADRRKKVRQLKDDGKTREQIAAELNVPITTVDSDLKATRQIPGETYPK